MKFTRRGLLGSFMMLPFFRGVKLEMPTPPKALGAIEPDWLLVSQLDEHSARECVTATFRAKHGEFVVGKSVEIAHNGETLFKGIVRRIRSEPGELDDIEAVDALSFYPLHEITVRSTLTAEDARKVGDAIMQTMRKRRTLV